MAETLKLTFVPEYATAKTVRFNEQLPEGDFLAQPVLGSLYIETTQLRALDWKGTVGEPSTEIGSNGKTYTRRPVIAGESFVMTLTKA